jgi:hypothetical protein
MTLLESTAWPRSASPLTSYGCAGWFEIGPGDVFTSRGSLDQVVVLWLVAAAVASSSLPISVPAALMVRERDETRLLCAPWSSPWCRRFCSGRISRAQGLTAFSTLTWGLYSATPGVPGCPCQTPRE